MAAVRDDILDLSWAKVPMFKALICYVLGIICGSWNTFLNPTWFLGLTILGLVGMAVGTIYRRKTPFKLLFQLSFLLFFVSLGIWKVSKQKPKHISNHFSKFQSDQLIGIIDDEPIVKEKMIRFPVRVVAMVDSGEIISAQGNLQITVFRDSIATKNWKYGDQIIFSNHAKLVDPPFNPHQFDYQKYLANKNIWYQNFVRSDEIKFLEEGKGNFFIENSSAWRVQLIEKFRKYIPNEEAYQIAIALIFGYRSQIDEDTMSAFTSTGTIHVLSVSGLHVGLLYGFLLILFSWMNRIRYGELIRTGLILIIIWSYVVLTGMSPPILRSGIMISFFMCSVLLSRKQIPLNTLFASAFFILLFSPHALLDVGFQLSYSAIAGIILMYPILRKFYLPENKYIGYIVEYIYVSIAAQLFTLPFALYYFGQFPNYFLPANLFIAIPSTLIMYSGVMLAVIPIDWLSEWLGIITSWLLLFMMGGLKSIEGLPYALTTGIYWDWITLLLLSVVIASLVVALDLKNKKAIWIMGISLLMMSVYQTWKRMDMQHYVGFRVYNIRSDIAIVTIDKGTVILYSSLDSLSHKTLAFSVLPDLRCYSEVEKIDFRKIDVSNRDNYVLNLRGQQFLILENKLTNFPANIDYVLWRKNNRNNITEVKRELLKAKFIVDGSNSDRNIASMHEETKEFDQSVYYLKNNFAYVWDEE